MRIINYVSLILLFHIYSFNSGIVQINSISNLRTKWAEYKKEYNQRLNGQEDEERFKVFVKNMEDIKKLNAENTGTVYGMNKFGHWTDDEFMEYVNQGAKILKQRVLAKPIYTKSRKNYPDIDWRQKGVVTGIKNQLRCGSCWAFSAAGQLETQYALIKNKTILLSEQDLVDCSTKFGNEGCNGGYMDKACEYVQKMGINSGSDYPYVGMDSKCKHSDKKSILKVKDIFHLPEGNESALANGVSTFGPISVGFAATEQLKFYKSGVFVDKECSPEGINHGMLLVGLGSKPSLHYIVKNSWGTSWGIKGYLLTAREKKNMCGIASMSSYATVVIQN